ncbi:MAG: DUF6282 family protein [Micromonosporaceae bacterium]
MTAASALANILDGLVDMHCHSGPSPFPRRFDHVDAARDGARVGMRAMVAKSHHHSTVMDVLAMKPRLESVSAQVYGGIALNTWVGGINPDAVQLCLNLGGKVVWFPTNCSGRHIDCHPELAGFPTPTVELNTTVVPMTDERGDLIPAVRQVLDHIAASGAVLNAGHSHPEHITQLFTAARDAGVDKMVVSHPDFVIGADVGLCRELISLGAVIEHEMIMYHPDGLGWDVRQLFTWIEQLGPENVVLSSDLGQATMPKPVDGFLGVAEHLLDLGLDPKSLRQMTVDTPGRLLGLDP